MCPVTGGSEKSVSSHHRFLELGSVILKQYVYWLVFIQGAAQALHQLVEFFAESAYVHAVQYTTALPIEPPATCKPLV